MPKYFKTKEIMLHSEAFASFILIGAKLANSICAGTISDKYAKLYDRANNRVYRRFCVAYPERWKTWE